MVLNFTPVVRENYILGVPLNIDYEEIYNSDNEKYLTRDVNERQELNPLIAMSESESVGDLEHWFHEV